MMRAVLTDIEGTTSSLAFVKDVLFPYARERIGGFVSAHAGEPEVAAQLDALREYTGEPDAGVDRLAGQLIRWIDEDRKLTPLKALQGLLWEQGYRTGDLQGHVYEDAAQALRRWHEQGLRLYVYSSGSVRAQRLLFAHTPFGDLTPLFDGFFDTRMGDKRESASYRRIAGEVGLAPDQMLFLSDVEAELDAARAAGMRTGWLVRDAAPEPNARHPQARDFTEIEAEKT